MSEKEYKLTTDARVKFDEFYRLGDAIEKAIAKGWSARKVGKLVRMAARCRSDAWGMVYEIHPELNGQVCTHIGKSPKGVVKLGVHQ